MVRLAAVAIFLGATAIACQGCGCRGGPDIEAQTANVSAGGILGGSVDHPLRPVAIQKYRTLAQAMPPTMA